MNFNEVLKKWQTLLHKDALYGGAYCENGDLIYIEKVIHNGPACIVLWSDGDKTISTCDAEDNYNAEMGLLICVLKKLMGNKWVAKLFLDWGVTGYKVRTLTDVRKDRRKK